MLSERRASPKPLKMVGWLPQVECAALSPVHPGHGFGFGLVSLVINFLANNVYMVHNSKGTKRGKVNSRFFSTPPASHFSSVIFRDILNIGQGCLCLYGQKACVPVWIKNVCVTFLCAFKMNAHLLRNPWLVLHALGSQGWRLLCCSCAS